jgi:hypothetical protein
MPYLPITLSNGSNSLEVMALLDTGASVNVLPYQIGLQLGATWEQQTVPIELSGNLAHSEARDWCFRVQFLSFRGSCLHLLGLDRSTCNPWAPQLFLGV